MTALLAIVGVLWLASHAAAQTPPTSTAPPATAAAHSDAPVEHATPAPGAAAQTAPPGDHAPAAQHADAGEHAAAEHRNPVVDTVARLINFAILIGTLVYFLKSPFNEYLTNRKTQIRSDLVKAADMKTSASAQLSAVDRKLAALPAELDELRKTGAAEVAAEEARIREIAEKERQRLLTQLQREIELQGRIAERELIRQAADRAVTAATGEINRTITPADHARLQERYVAMVGK